MGMADFLMLNQNLARGQKENFPVWKRVVLGLIGCAMLTSLLGSQGAPQAQASQPVGDVIYNYPYNPASPPTGIADYPYVMVDHNGLGVYDGYELAYTPDISAYYNGTATPDHVVIDGSTINFYGYGVMPYMDYYFVPADLVTASAGNSFNLIPANMNFHSFSESGYLFNGKMTLEGGRTYYTGYAITLTCGNAAGMLENNPDADNTASLRLYYIDHELWNTGAFTPGSVLNSRTLVATIKTGITNFDTTSYRVSTEIDPTTRAFKVYVDGVMYANVTNPVGGASGPQGFGFYTGYYSHSCTRLTRMRFEQITSNVEIIPAVPVGSEVDFVDQSTGAPIRAPETEQGYAPFQKYKIVQPKTIDYGGTTYYLVSNSRTNPAANQSDINLTYDLDPANNVTTLYYAKASDLASQAPKKDARVNGGDWDSGLPAAPVSVVAGDSIEYGITAYHAPAGVAMLTPGTNTAATTTDWWGQGAAALPSPGSLPAGSALSGPLMKNQISKVVFEDLSSMPYYDAATPGYSAVMCAQFLSQNPNWKGQPVLEAWDATDTGANNPDSAISRVIAWVTVDPAAPGKYCLYVGGKGGVYLSSTSANISQFGYFTSLASGDFANLHTDLAINMVYMFYYCTALTSLDLRSFNTSNVTSMANMFFYCTGLQSVNLSSFNTSNVMSMSALFYYCSNLTSLNLKNFDTANVTNMGSMFQGCAGIIKLDLSNFNTSNVTTMASMFYNCTSLQSVILSSFDTSNVTGMSNMFYSCSSLASLNLDTFTTAKVTSMVGMFYNCRTLPSLNLRTFDTSKVTGMSTMFQLCASLTSLDLSTFDTSKVTSMSSMFSSCNQLKSLVLTNFDTSNVIDMTMMFSSCSSLTTLDVSSFNTIKVTSMSNMFALCESLISLDLSTFDTSIVTNMASMFLGCTKLTSAGLVGINQFNVAKVVTFSSMFQNCTSLTSLNLYYWRIGAIPSANVSAMFGACPGLSVVHLESSSLDLLSASNASGMFDYTLPAGAVVYVGTTPARTWLTTTFPTVFPSRTVSIVAPTGTAPLLADWQSNKVAPDTQDTPTNWLLVTPTNWLDNFTGTFGTTDTGQTTVTDTIPDGLTIDLSTITGVESSDTIDDAITWQVDGQTITWQVPSDMLPKTLTVTVTVDAGQANGKDFINIAYVGDEPTNPTYHRFKDAWRVTEQYFIYDGGPTTTQLDNDLTTLVDSGAAYNVQGPLDSLSGYTYYGYQRMGIDSDITTGTPPTPAFDDGVASPVHSSDFGTTNQEVIKLYYQRKAVTVTINFVDENGAVIKSPVAVVIAANTDYYLLMSYFNSFTTGGGAQSWTYYDYMKNGDDTVADVAPPVTPPLLGASPVYPDGAVPTFPASLMNTDRNVTLCFTDKQAVTVHFVEDGNPSHVLHPDETYFCSNTFDPTLATRTDGSTQVALPADISDILSGATIRTYSYTSHYVLNGGSTQNGFPGTVSAPADIVLFFSTTYTVTEKFHAVYDSETMAAAPVLAPDLVHPDLPGGYVFNPMDDPAGMNMPPARIGAYIYIGYKLTNDSNPLNPGYPPAPLINGVWDDYDIIYVYDRAPGYDFSFTKLGEGNVSLEGVTFKLTPRNSTDDGWDSAEATTIASATDGTVTFASLTDKTSYLLEETQTLSGYALPSGYWILSVDTSSDPIFSFASQGSPMAFAYDSDTGAYTLTNYKVTHLPFSGSWGVITFVVAGVVLLGLAVLAATSSRGKGKHGCHRKRQKNSSP